MVIDPALSADGNVGVELFRSWLGIYTDCCNSDPLPTPDAWKCASCGTGIHTKARVGLETSLDITKHSDGDLTFFANTWLSRGDVKIKKSLP